MLRLAASTRCARPAAIAAGRPSPPLLLLARSYAQPAPDPPPPPPPPGSSSQSKPVSASQQRPNRPTPVATASTLTLFAQDPVALVVALRSTLTGLIDANARASPPTEPNPNVLLFALSKNLPSELLQHALAILNGDSGFGTESDTLIRLGALTNSIPLGLLPQHAVTTSASSSSNPAPSDPDTPLHSVALSLLPGTHARAFRSHLHGRAQIQVGRWPQQKQRWKSDDRASGVDDLSAQAETSWVALWGKENANAELPQQIAKVAPQSHLTTILFSDPAPQGLLEGLDANFQKSSLLGLLAPPTPFETNGRDQTLLFTLPGSDASERAFATGAVGVVLHNPSAETGARPPLDRPFPDGLRSLPLTSAASKSSQTELRHSLTGARGNIISQLNGANAAQVFLSDLHARTESTSPSGRQSASPSQRDMARGAKKDEEFFVGVYRSQQVGDKHEEPLLLAPLLSGAPSRGTLSLDTEVDLGPGPGVFRPAGQDSGLYVQFFYREQKSTRDSPPVSASTLDPISIPGPDPSVWAMPRFMFLALPSSWSEHATTTLMAAAAAAASSGSNSDKTSKPKVMALPNLFVAASDRGWVGKDSAPVPKEESGKEATKQSVVERLKHQSQSGNVPFSRAVLSFKTRQN
ncbi:hypothetical protein OC846_005799 [Tilletia horrida]|uniref:FIST domain-containing protein n=1 Tax=Tilletia horrida TaxID=155126 RepID=A0AAN6GMP1_9BASI|nr:hypothetical protein OC846_005799 [Tilletia horrida]KAK0570265.1 hypothetical protein OC861_000008 [Tilletia horrida]